MSLPIIQSCKNFEQQQFETKQKILSKLQIDTKKFKKINKDNYQFKLRKIMNFEIQNKKKSFYENIESFLKEKSKCRNYKQTQNVQHRFNYQNQHLHNNTIVQKSQSGVDILFLQSEFKKRSESYQSLNPYKKSDSSQINQNSQIESTRFESKLDKNYSCNDINSARYKYSSKIENYKANASALKVRDLISKANFDELSSKELQNNCYYKFNLKQKKIDQKVQQLSQFSQNKKSIQISKKNHNDFIDQLIFENSFIQKQISSDQIQKSNCK